MSGRHRHTEPGITRRALDGTVPVLGVAGAATGLALSSGAAVSPVADPGATEDAVAPAAAQETTAPVVDEPVAPAGTSPTVRTAVPGRADQAVSAVSAATDAARR